jgi:hypothetical protein
VLLPLALMVPPGQRVQLEPLALLGQLQLLLLPPVRLRNHRNRSHHRHR